ncbi:MAG TPA: aromatic ring-hydroxylating dioxygenase subunit alpha [Burkholderiales bacterium]|nr:aromatic ring-hydroxylating dioxygenase subunit alpha [Burkholderiales bacterium]
MFLRNAWYVAAWDREVARAPVARTLLGEPVVLYRKADGTPVALEDRCCHRSLPLSMGRLEGDELRCGYHGLRFDASGACTEIPGQASIPPQARVRAYPLVERYHWLWIWMGERSRADPALIPEWRWAADAAWAFTRPDPVRVACDYRLVSDNVLDVTHLAYVHAGSIGAPSITEFPATVEREARRVRLTRWIRDRPPPPLYRKAGGFPGNVDRWQIVEHVPPCFTVNFAGCEDGERRIELMALSAPTPETERSTRYHFGFVRNFGLGDPDLERICSEDMVRVFHEDFPVLEAQQRALDAQPGAPRVDIQVDAAPLAARRLLERLIAAERAFQP